ncbi:MAG: hypothetical protein K2X47_18170, partial [Bdellovibrionales bacterium]|nr:hypothetical protein [Bdellovibrionales bacterium]
MKHSVFCLLLLFNFVGTLGCGRLFQGTELRKSPIDHGRLDSSGSADVERVLGAVITSVVAYQPYPTYIADLVSERGQLDLEIHGSLNPTEQSQDFLAGDVSFFCGAERIQFQDPNTGAARIRIQPGQIRVIFRLPARQFAMQTCSVQLRGSER